MNFWYTTAVGYIREWLTDICLVGAAVSFAAYLALRHARRIARVSDWLVRVPRSQLAAFALFAAIATVCAQKQGGTNAPPNGASPPQMAGMMTPGFGNLELGMVHGGVVAAGGFTVLHSPLYILHSVTTNETYSYAMPTNGMRYERWWLRGACKCKMENVEWRMSA